MQPERIRKLNSKPVREDGEYVVYWSQMNRRVESNHGLGYAVELANSRGIPVLYYEGLGCTYPYANDRLHTFMLEGVPDTAKALTQRGIGYAYYLRRTRKDRNDTLYEVAAKAAAVVSDDYPTFVAARHNRSVPDRLACAYSVVDSSCIVPMGRFEKREWAAYTIRPKIHKLLPTYMNAYRTPSVKQRWNGRVPDWHVAVKPERIARLVAECEIDHSVKPSPEFHGGASEAKRRLRRFLEYGLRDYAKHRNEPSAHATSELSPYLHFGQISSLQIAIAVSKYAEENKLIAHEFLEELIVRRELAFNFTRFTPNYYSLEALPDWAKKTLAIHASDVRDPMYTRQQLEFGETYDALWNATQQELLVRGKIHGYYRMYWGKKIIEWSRTHAEALEIMIYLHDKYALDGRDPNTYTNILWCFGLHDRPWVERPIFGQVRFMSYDGMRRKTDVDAYIQEIREMETT